LLAPYEEEDAPDSIQAPALKLDNTGVERWQYDLWFQIIRAELEGQPDQVDLTYHAALGKPVASRYGATTPKLLRWFKTFNQNRVFRDQVKPFNQFPIGFPEQAAAQAGGDAKMLADDRN
jgi:hypothetical protein